MRIIYVWIIILSTLSPAYAYGSGNTIYVKRETTKKPSLLDRKFVYRQVEASASSAPVTTNLTAMHQQYSSTVTKSAAAQKQNTRARETTKPASSDNWNDFAVESEYEESRNVSAKLML